VETVAFAAVIVSLLLPVRGRKDENGGTIFWDRHTQNQTIDYVPATMTFAWVLDFPMQWFDLM
jgi:hypothetical protein